MKTSLPFMSFHTGKPPSIVVIHKWIQKELQLNRQMYDMIQITAESSTGYLTERTCLPIDVARLHDKKDQIVLIVLVMTKNGRAKSGRVAVKQKSETMYIATMCTKSVLLSAVVDGFATLKRIKETPQISEIHLSDHHDVTATPYIHNPNDEFSEKEMEECDIIELVGNRLRLISDIRRTPEDCKTIAKEAEQLFKDVEKDMVSLHLACVCLSMSPCKNIVEFAECESILLKERMLLRGLQPSREPTTQKEIIIEDMMKASMYFSLHPLQCEPHESIVKQAIPFWT